MKSIPPPLTGSLWFKSCSTLHIREVSASAVVFMEQLWVATFPQKAAADGLSAVVILGTVLGVSNNGSGVGSAVLGRHLCNEMQVLFNNRSLLKAIHSLCYLTDHNMCFIAKRKRDVSANDQTYPTMRGHPVSEGQGQRWPKRISSDSAWPREYACTCIPNTNTTPV